MLVGYVLFRGNGLMAAFKMIRSMFTVYNPWVFTDGTLMTLGLDAANWNVLILSMLVLLAVSVANENGINVREKIARQNIILQWICYLAGIFAVLILEFTVLATMFLLSCISISKPVSCGGKVC